MTTPQRRMVAARFTQDVRHHGLTVVHDHDGYRHLKLRKPDRSEYWFDLVTWPGHLSITGDMGAHTFARLPDMFVFFRPDKADRGINPSYWAEKIVTGAAGVKAYSQDVFKQLVTEYVDDRADDYRAGLRETVQRSLDLEYTADENGAREWLRDFSGPLSADGLHHPFQFVDAWEWDLSEYTDRFLWCCHAVQWGIAQYDSLAKL